MLVVDLTAPRKQRHTARRVLARLVDEHGFTDLRVAEYLAVTRLQADALVAADPEIVAAARGVVPTAELADLLSA